MLRGSWDEDRRIGVGHQIVIHAPGLWNVSSATESENAKRVRNPEEKDSQSPDKGRESTHVPVGLRPCWRR